MAKNKTSYKSFLFLISLILSIILVYMLFLIFNSFEERKPVCGDETPYNECSPIQPYYCLDGNLIEKATICHCPKLFVENGDSCISEYHENPRQITLKYILEGNESEIDFTVYEEMLGYLLEVPRIIEYNTGEEPSRVDFKLKSINEENQREFLLPLVVEIQNLTSDKEEQAKIAISLVQNIEWGFSNKTTRFRNVKLNYSRYPYEVLFDSQGICGEKSQLLAFLLKELGYGVAIFYNQLENHESVGVKCLIEESWYDSGYCFIETSGPSVISDTSITYVGGIKVNSKPEVLLISEGISFGDNLQEYKDAKRLSKIRKKIEETGRINPLDNFELEKLKQKYGLVDEYNLA